MKQNFSDLMLSAHGQSRAQQTSPGEFLDFWISEFEVDVIEIHVIMPKLSSVAQLRQ